MPKYHCVFYYANLSEINLEQHKCLKRKLKNIRILGRNGKFHLKKVLVPCSYLKKGRISSYPELDSLLMDSYCALKETPK